MITLDTIPEVFQQIVPLSMCLQLSKTLRESAARWYIEFTIRRFQGNEKAVCDKISVYQKLWNLYTFDDCIKYFSQCDNVGFVYRGFVRNRSHGPGCIHDDRACHNNNHNGSEFVFSNICSRVDGYLIHGEHQFDVYYPDDRLLNKSFQNHIYSKNIHRYLYPFANNMQDILAKSNTMYKYNHHKYFILDTRSMYKLFWISSVGDIAREFPRLTSLVNKLIITRVARYLTETNDFMSYRYEIILDDHMRRALAEVNNRILGLVPNENDPLLPSVEWLMQQ